MGQTSHKDQIHHDIAGIDILQSSDRKFKQYRRKWDENPRNLVYGEFPLHIDIEVTSCCNLKCPFCATTFRIKEIDRGLISFEAVKKIIDEGVANGMYGVKFNIRGEPLLHPQIYDFIKYAKNKGLIDVYFNTNGMLLNEHACQKLIEAGLISNNHYIVNTHLIK